MALPSVIAALNVDDAITDAWVDAVKADIEYLDSAKPDVGGWVPVLTATLLYASTDGHTFVVTTSVDMTGTISVGARIKLTHAAAVKYFIVTAITAGQITLYGGTSYTLAVGAITAVSYSTDRTPYGFPANPILWTEEIIDTNTRAQGTPVAGTWYNPGPIALPVPIGAWRLLGRFYLVATAAADMLGGLSSVLATASDLDMLSQSNGCTGAITAVEKNVLLSVKTSYYLVLRINTGGMASVQINGSPSSVIRAVCNYL